MKKLLASFIAFLSISTVFVGCANEGGGGTAVCPSGYVLSGNVCVYGNGAVPGVSGTVTYGDYNRKYVSSWGGTSTVSGDMTIVNTGAFKTFLKEAMAVCDRNIWGINSGLSDCSSWTSGSFEVSFSVDSSMRPVVRFAAYPAPSWFSWNFSLGWDAGGMAFNPLVLNTNNTFNLINQSQGFEIRAQGSMWNGGGLRWIQIQVLQGTLNDGYFHYDIYYPHNGVATKFASGKFKRF